MSRNCTAIDVEFIIVDSSLVGSGLHIQSDDMSCGGLHRFPLAPSVEHSEASDSRTIVMAYGISLTVQNSRACVSLRPQEGK